MDIKHDIEAVERRAFAARYTMAEVCDRAGIHQSTWSRCKLRQAISVVVLRKIEFTLGEMEAERVASC